MKTSGPLNKFVTLGVVFFFASLAVIGWAISSMGAKAVIGLFIFLLFVAVAKYPEFGLLYFSIGFDSFGYIADIMNIPEGLRSLVFAAGLLFILCVFICIRRKDLSCLVDKTLFAAILLGVFIAVSTQLHPYSEYGIWKAQAYLLFNLFTMAAPILFSNEPLDQRRMIYAAALRSDVGKTGARFIPITGKHTGRNILIKQGAIGTSRECGTQSAAAGGGAVRRG